MSARDLLEIAAEYADARDAETTIANLVGSGVDPGVDLDEIAGRFDAALRQYVADISTSGSDLR